MRQPVHIDSFEYLAKLGAGAFGTVWKVRHKGTGETFAMKTLLRSMLESEGMMSYARTERHVMSSVRHPFIVSLFYAFQTDKQLVLVMRYCSGGSLQRLIRREGRLAEPVARHYTAEVLLALKHLHELGILYRDLKPENVVLEARHALLTDFGLAKRQHSGRSFLGSADYVAPEVLLRQAHDHTVDIYGLGVLLFTLLQGVPPFKGRSREQTWQQIREAPLQLAALPSLAASFVADTMRRVPAERLGAASTGEVQGHQFFAGVDFEALLRLEVPVPALASRDPWCCPRCHSLEPFTTSHGNYACNDCGERQPLSATMHGCRLCDYDLCARCRFGLDSEASEPQSVFGSRLCARACRCFDPEPDPDWDYVGSVIRH